jgi:hypothetical protein
MGSSPSPPEPSRVSFPCPLCWEALERDVAITAELDLTTSFVLIADLAGCPHAERFGAMGRLTLEEEWRLIGAALDAHEAAREGGGAGECA